MGTFSHPPNRQKVGFILMKEIFGFKCQLAKLLTNTKPSFAVLFSPSIVAHT